MNIVSVAFHSRITSENLLENEQAMQRNKKNSKTAKINVSLMKPYFIGFLLICIACSLIFTCIIAMEMGRGGGGACDMIVYISLFIGKHCMLYS